MKPIAILPYEGPKMAYSQNPAAMTFAILSKDNRLMHEPVMCKDYIPDAFWSENVKKSAEVYGFYWTPGLLPLDQEAYKFQMKLPEKVSERIDTVAKLLGIWSRRLGFGPTKIHITEDKNTFIIEVRQEWTKQAVRLSFLFHLIRIASAWDRETMPEFFDRVISHKGYVATEKDRGYTKSALPLLLKVWKDKAFPEQNWTDFKEVYAAHGSSGICAVARKLKATQ